MYNRVFLSFALTSAHNINVGISKSQYSGNHLSSHEKFQLKTWNQAFLITKCKQFLLISAHFEVFLCNSTQFSAFNHFQTFDKNAFSCLL